MSTQEMESPKSGWEEFAAVVLFAIGFFRIISAIAYFANSYKLNNLTNGLFSSHNWAWGVWDLMIATLAIFAGLSILSGGGFGRVVGYIWAVLVIVQAFTVINLAVATVFVVPAAYLLIHRNEATVPVEAQS